jgi:4-hydroxybenzoate polyprenyltransferase
MLLEIKMLYARTLPIVIGAKKAAQLASLILLLAPLFFVVFFFLQVQQNYIKHIVALLPFLISCILCFLSIILLISGYNKQNRVKVAHDVIKIAMLSGILMPFYWLMLK